ncbi:MAG: hypothetical protein FJ164_07975 [Gammaproteobacteria bacterium]|nr:hypothetical protein [Gammaproteobacteria bacterium]
MIEGKVDPQQMGRFDFNFQDETNVNQELSSQQPVKDSNGAGASIYWNETSFDAKLAAPSINLRTFPFDRQKLSIMITSPVHETGELAFRILQFRLPQRVFNIPGYRLDGITYADEVRIYTSNFQDGSDVSWLSGTATTQSQATFNIFISRSLITSLFKYIAPLAIVSFLGIAVIPLGARYREVKLAAPPAAVLSLIFLQNSFAQDLPRVHYMTCMDLMFFISFLVCLLSFADGLVSSTSRSKDYRRSLFGILALGIFALSPLLVIGWLGASAST